MRASIESALAAHAPVGRADDLGALEPRRDEARRRATAAPTRRSRSSPSEPARPPTWSAAPGAPGQPRCWRWRCPARCTSTRARSSACPRSRTSRPTAARIRCGTARAASTPAATAAASRCPGRATQPPYGFSAGRSRPALARPARRLGAAHRRGPVRGRDLDARPLPRGPAPAPDRPLGLGDGDLRWIPSSESVLAFARGERFTCLVNFGPDPVDLPAGADVLHRQQRARRRCAPADTTVWLRQAATAAHRIGQPDRTG